MSQVKAQNVMIKPEFLFSEVKYLVKKEIFSSHLNTRNLSFKKKKPIILTSKTIILPELP